MEAPIKDVLHHIREVLRGAGDGGMDAESLKAAVSLSMEIETLQAALRLLQTRKVLGSLDDTGEVVLAAKGND